MNNFYMLVGIPGSGKSTVGNELNAKVFSSDKIREELWGDENIQGDNCVIFDELHKRIKECLSNGDDCVYDATNIKANKRANFLREIKKLNCNKICIFVATDIDMCLERNSLRERHVPEEVIIKMYRGLEIPQYREGWDEIRVIPNRHPDKDYNIFHLVDRLRLLNHDNPHHLLTVGDHICGVTQYIVKNYGFKFALDVERLSNLISAAFYHDIGKEFTKSFVNGKGEETEVAHYYNHENVSAYMYFLYTDLETLNEDMGNSLYIADLIQLHMRMHCHGGDKEKMHNKIKKLVGQQEFEDLCILNEADTICG